MKIAILGTRGVPNNYGGFEQFAEVVSEIFVQDGHHVEIYNPTDHPYTEGSFKGVQIKRIYSNEHVLKFLNSFVFDYLCLRDASKSDFDIILELGYHPAALFYRLHRSGALIVTNMAGMEWRRSKWGAIARSVIRFCERKAVENSDAIVSDNEEIANYYRNEYGVETAEIAYGAFLPKLTNTIALTDYGLTAGKYLMLIARFQPDNNFEMILDGYKNSSSVEPFVVVGSYGNNYGRYLSEKYRGEPLIKFVGPIYDYQLLSNLRFHSRIYFHGHSCGGTNPSLLEAMASEALIVAHDNGFNRSVLGSDAQYFESDAAVTRAIDQMTQDARKTWTRRNREKVETQYNWDTIASQYLNLFSTLSITAKTAKEVVTN